MSYAQGGLIEAADYNTIIGANTSVSSTTLNAVWAWGANSAGYGQTAVPQVSAQTLVTATQWATLINSLNSANTHINGSSSGLTANTSGQLIGFSGSLQDKITGLYNDRQNFASNSAVVANVSLVTPTNWSFTPGGTPSTPTASTLTRGFGLRASFANGADAARFFFNAGGRMKFNCSGTNNIGSSRSGAVAPLFNNLGGIALFAANTAGGRTGAGGTVTANVTNQGYYQLTTSNVTFVAITTSSVSYTADTASILVRSNGPTGSFGDNGSQIDFWVSVTSATGANTDGFQFDDTIDVNVNLTLDVSFPEVTNLSNTWGAVVVTKL